MIYVNSKKAINYNPKNKEEEVTTNVGMILRIFKEEQPLNRDFAFDSDLIDKNMNIVRNKMTTMLLQLFKKYEPRAILKQTDLKMSDKAENGFDIYVGIEVMK